MTDPVGALQRLPEEMRWARQWFVAGPDKSPYTAGKNGLFRASVTSPAHYMDFETACSWARQVGGYVGYVLHEQDPYTCIDLDVKDSDNCPGHPEQWTDQATLNRYWAIVQGLQSYTELSRSGKGIHIWVRGKIGVGRRHKGIEIYSQERFIICTGNVLLDLPIVDRQEMLDQFVDEVQQLSRNSGAKLSDYENHEDMHNDAEILEIASNAVNGEKFNALCRCTATDPDTGELGSFTELGYSSQSEADIALMSMFTFYSKSNEQCRRLFRMTPMGKRPKAVQDDKYLDRTIAKRRAAQAQEKAAEAHGADIARALVANMQAQYEHQLGQHADTTSPQGPVTAAVVANMTAKPDVPTNGLPWPPGFIGSLASFIYASSPRPVREVSIVAALGFIAGICGRTWLLPQSGLNLYVILVARSAVGKEAMHSGISILLNKLLQSMPLASAFIDFSDFASGPALQKAVAANPCFLNISGEWGRKLRRLASDDGRDGPMQQLRTVMTNLYQKSGPTSIVGGITYSNKEGNIGSVNGVSYSMIGETTPDTYYQSLTESMMADGFLSRFTVIEYDGPRPPRNDAQVLEPDAPLVEHLRSLVAYSGDLQNRPAARVYVQRDEQAAALLNAFDLECDAEINATLDESWRQMWNRAHLKVLRVSALLAVADNPANPWMTAPYVEWALDVVRRDIAMMQRKMRSGDIGTDDHAREKKLMAVVEEFLSAPPSAGYNVPEAVWKGGIVPRKVLQIRTARINAFSTHRLGATGVLDLTLRSLIDSGYLVEMDKGKLMADYGLSGKHYRILSKRL